MSANTQVEYVPTTASNKTLNAFFDKAMEKFTNDARKRYDIFLEANKKPLTMAERFKHVSRAAPVSFETYLKKCIEATKGTVYKCDFYPIPRGRTLDRLPPNMMRWPSPDGLCHEEEPNGKHYCHHPAFGYQYGLGTRYGTHYNRTYNMEDVEKHHLEEVARARRAQWRDIDFS